MTRDATRATDSPQSRAEAPVVIGLGELLWDEFEDGRRPGGAPANVAYQATQLGLAGRIASRVGRDEDGDRLVEQVRRKGLDVQLVQVDGEHLTGRVTIDLEDGQPSYSIHPAAWDYIETTEPLTAACEQAAAICFGTLAQRGETSQATIAACCDAAGPLKVFDVNLRQSYYSRDILEASLQHADVVKFNHDEALVIAKLLQRDADSLPQSLRQDFEIGLVCITRGAEGCELIADERVFQPSEPVEVADAVGAGDAFTAALTYATLHEWPLMERARLANAVGGLVASQRGAMPDIAERVASLLADIHGKPAG